MQFLHFFCVIKIIFHFYSFLSFAQFIQLKQPISKITLMTIPPNLFLFHCYDHVQLFFFFLYIFFWGESIYQLHYRSNSLILYSERITVRKFLLFFQIYTHLLNRPLFYLSNFQNKSIPIYLFFNHFFLSKRHLAATLQSLILDWDIKMGTYYIVLNSSQTYWGQCFHLLGTKTPLVSEANVT